MYRGNEKGKRMCWRLREGGTGDEGKAPKYTASQK